MNKCDNCGHSELKTGIFNCSINNEQGYSGHRQWPNQLNCKWHMPDGSEINKPSPAVEAALKALFDAQKAVAYAINKLTGDSYER